LEANSLRPARRDEECVVFTGMCRSSHCGYRSAKQTLS
jgi:hypothetical protein